MRLSHRMRQQAWLAGNACHELRDEADRVGKACSALAPYPCELSPPLVPFSAASLLRGSKPGASRPRRARKRDIVHYRLWFRAGEEVDWRQFQTALRQIALSGRATLTKSVSGRKTMFTVTVEKDRRRAVEGVLKDILPGLELVAWPGPFCRLERLLAKGYRLEICRLYPTTPYWRGFPLPDRETTPPVQHELAALSQIRPGIGFIQTIFERAPDGWASNVAALQDAEERALRLSHAGPWSFDGIEANKKLSPNAPLYFAALRCGVCVPPDASLEALDVVSRPYRSVMHGSRPLAALDTADHLAVLGSPERLAQMLDQNDIHAAGCLMTEDELARFVHTPSASMLEDADCRLDRTFAPPAPERIRTGGTRIGWQPYADRLLPVVIPDRVRDRHVSFEGKTGAGKSVSLCNLLLGDLDNPAVRGGIVLDLHGVLCPHLLDQIAPDRADKTIYLDTTCPGHVLKYNPLADSSGDTAKRVDDTVSSIELLYKVSEWGSNIALDTAYYVHLLHACPGLCLADASVLLSKGAAGDRLRQLALSHVQNEEVIRYWEEEFRRLPPARARKALSKVVKFLSQASGRMFRQTANAVDWRKWMEEGYLVLVNLPIGRLGGTTADMIASWILAQVFNAAMERVLGPVGDKGLWVIYLDEAQRVAARVTEEALTQLRKAGTPLVLAVQSRDQISGKGNVALRNIGTLISLNAGYEDAHRFAHEFGGRIRPEQFLGLRVGHAWGLIDREVVQLRLLPPRKPREKSCAKEIIDRSLADYYMTEEEFQEELRKRRERLGLHVEPKEHRGYDYI